VTGRRAAVVVLTGAGVSADSGLATFRGAGGLWEGNRVEDVATPEAWRADPARVWRFYQERRAGLSAARPNAAHLALAQLERGLGAAGARFTLVTQNVDDLHERAGSRALLHVHGELAVLRCERCGQRVRDLERCDPTRFLPCAACSHARLRPDVVWFGELPRHLDEIEAALAACTHFLALGTSGVVWPVAGFLEAARRRGARTLVSALEPPDNLELADEFHAGRAVDLVPGLCARLLGECRS
jgi:NAD-dependent deacetylase